MADEAALLTTYAANEEAVLDSGEIVSIDGVRSPLPPGDGIAGYVRETFHIMKEHEESKFIHDGHRENLRSYKGQYTPQKLHDIRQFGGSTVFSRITSVKCRGATAMLRDVFLGEEDIWAIEPTPVPDIPDEIAGEAIKITQSEVALAKEAGEEVDETQVKDRLDGLMAAAQEAAKKEAVMEAKKATQYMNDVLIEGGFEQAMVDFLTDLPVFKFACIKGPIVENDYDIEWSKSGKMKMKRKPRMKWRRVNPQDLYFTPGATNVADSAVIEHQKLSRADLNALLGLPGYNDDMIRAAIEEYEYGLYEQRQDDSDRADIEDRESPAQNRSELLDTLEYHGSIKGSELLAWGFSSEAITDPVLDYFVTAWIVGSYTIKVMLDPNPKKRPPYYMTSYEKSPGSMIGNGVTEIISDIQDVANACLRSLVNNMSIASGPQVAINEDTLSPTTDADNLYPWKRWRFTSDPLGNSSQKPIDFFQPQSNAGELLQVYQAMTVVADEVSAIPRYMTGSGKGSGASRTASGLSMLMNNSSKVLQMVAANIDKDVVEPLIQGFYDFIMLVDKGKNLRGDERIRVKGVTVAVQRETERVRRLEFLQMTGNEIDMQIVGMEGRAEILREIASDLGMEGSKIVPTEAELKAKQEQVEEQARKMAEQEAMGGMSPGGSPPGLVSDAAAEQPVG